MLDQLPRASAFDSVCVSAKWIFYPYTMAKICLSWLRSTLVAMIVDVQQNCIIEKYEQLYQI